MSDSIDALLQPTRSRKLSQKQVGCQFCPLNKTPGIKKIFGTVEGKSIFVWAMCPGKDENKQGQELVGRSGQLLWAELRRVGIKREMCDIQNVVRCFTADYDDSQYPPLISRNPSKEEIHCCSLYTRQALEQQRAKVHLIFGEVAAKAVLGNEYKKGRKSFWSDRLNAQVMCLYHPAYFVRKGYGGNQSPAPDAAYKQWRADFEHAASLVRAKGRYSYIEEQEYYGIRKRKQADAAYEEIKEAAKKGWRIAVDVEYGVLPNGRQAALCCGFSVRAGEAFVFVLGHQEGVLISAEDRDYNWIIVRRILRDSEIKKAMHWGSSDARAFERLMNVEIQGYDYDTFYGEYFYDSAGKSFGLAAIANRRFPEFAGYKSILAPEVITPEFAATYKETSKVPMGKRLELAWKRGAINLAQVPWKKLVRYNGADCDLTKRIETSTNKFVDISLMHLYRDVGMIMQRMEQDGPLFDYSHAKRLFELYPVRVERWKRRLQKIAQNKEFNPGSPDQVKRLLFGKLELQMPGGVDAKLNTQSDTLELMKGQHPACDLIIKFRKDSKILSTYLEGFKHSADLHEGKLKTKWNMTGTQTGRLSSGAGKSQEENIEAGLVNLQNVHSDPQMQNMLVSDQSWRDITKWYREYGPFDEKNWQRFEDYYVFVGLDQAQFEMRVIAERSGDRNLIDVFRRGEDIHATVGYELTGISKDILSKEGPDRVAIKGMHFGIVYGFGAQGLYDHIRAKLAERNMKFEHSREWVARLLDSYFKKYAAVKAMLDRDKDKAEKMGYVETMFGFRRYLNVQEQKSLGSEWGGAYWANQAGNTPIQGSAHQLLMIGLLPIIREPEQYRLLRRPQLEVHDAMYFKTRLKNMWKVAKQGKEMLEVRALQTVRDDFGYEWKTPLLAEPKAGFRFGVMCKDLGTKGPRTTADFLNQFCEKSLKSQQALKAEIEKEREAEPVE